GIVSLGRRLAWGIYYCLMMSFHVSTDSHVIHAGNFPFRAGARRPLRDVTRPMEFGNPATKWRSIACGRSTRGRSCRRRADPCTPDRRKKTPLKRGAKSKGGNAPDPGHPHICRVVRPVQRSVEVCRAL